ncbi:Double-strand break repair protein MRE11 [Smittium mucronatum]|uniref:Double-strand break repair protein MRE11 n=1 Tax=Smittium mucronatum TaxID=133383 RepID=A0A1R0GN68_9FUNG|nr:Double-strand break repair protein MRE11 [Smittium mucronatum]OLY83847.1 Double-strand break repair protein MRE11 [Smittium mucronatum]
MSDTENQEDEFRIFIATDNHLGYLEKDPIRGNDSFYAFEEILQLAVEKNADFLLLGGDLFHVNQPSRNVMHKTLTLLRKYCLGNKKNNVEFLSDPKEGSLSAIDILSDSGLVNYFGKSKNIDRITLDPILLKKHNTRVAIYGLGSIRDERLYRTMANKRLSMNRPDQNRDDYFNIMVFHQNRCPHGGSSHIPEDFLEDFIDVVLWGHEHDCYIDPQVNENKKFYVIQPGSSIATSLSIGESLEKYVGLLTVTGKKFKLEKIRLQNVRPFVMSHVELNKVPQIKQFSPEEKIIEYLRFVTDRDIEEASKKYEEQLSESIYKVTNFLGPNPKPLIRVRVEYSGGFEPFFAHRFGMNYLEIVANPRDILLFYKNRKTKLLLEDPKALNGEEDVSAHENKVGKVVESFIQSADLSFLLQNIQQLRRTKAIEIYGLPNDEDLKEEKKIQSEIEDNLNFDESLNDEELMDNTNRDIKPKIKSSNWYKAGKDSVDNFENSEDVSITPNEYSSRDYAENLNRRISVKQEPHSENSSNDEFSEINFPSQKPKRSTRNTSTKNTTTRKPSTKKSILGDEDFDSNEVSNNGKTKISDYFGSIAKKTTKKDTDINKKKSTSYNSKYSNLILRSSSANANSSEPESFLDLKSSQIKDEPSGETSEEFGDSFINDQILNGENQDLVEKNKALNKLTVTELKSNYFMNSNSQKSKKLGPVQTPIVIGETSSDIEELMDFEKESSQELVERANSNTKKRSSRAVSKTTKTGPKKSIRTMADSRTNSLAKTLLQDSDDSDEESFSFAKFSMRNK